MKLRSVTRRNVILPGLLVGLGLALSVSAAPLQPATVVDPATEPLATGSGASFDPRITPDGAFVLFASTADNLLAPGSNQLALTHGYPKLQVFRRDRVQGVTALVSVKARGTEACSDDCLPTGLSTNGQYALFESGAGDLADGDTNGATDVFLRDLVQGTTRLVSVSTNGGCANGRSAQSVMSPDGRYVAFVSAANNLVPNDTNGVPDVFVRDVQTSQTVLASPGVTPGSSSSAAPRITPDGRYVAFLSSATNLAPGISTPNEVYVRDLVLGVTYTVSTNIHQYVTNTTLACNHAISDDGQYVAFEAQSASSTATNGMLFRYSLRTDSAECLQTNAAPAILSGFRHFRSVDMTPDGRFIAYVAKTNSGTLVYLWDSQSASATLVSADTNNTAPVGALCESPSLDSTGQYVAFLSTATNLTTNVVAGMFHLYVRDVLAGTTALVDAGPSGSGAAKSLLNVPRMTPDGRCVAFDATDADLVAGDGNQAYDVFVHDLQLRRSELISARDPSLVSRTAVGEPGRGFSLSGAGSCLVFSCAGFNLVPGCTNANAGVFLRDLVNGTNQLVSLDTNALAGANGVSLEPVLSEDGRWVAFTSKADNLVSGDANKSVDVFLRDRQSGVTTLVSVNAGKTGSGNGASYQPRMSADGRAVLFRSRATNLASGSFSTTYDNLFWRDVASGTTRAVVATGVNAEAMTPDGRFVAYSGASGNLYVWDSQAGAAVYTSVVSALSPIAISPDGNRVAGLKGSQVYVFDRGAGTNGVLVPAATAAATHANLQFSADGQQLVYATATAQAALDTNGVTDVYVYDFATQSHRLVSASYDGLRPGNGPSDSPVLSADGRFVAFRSTAGNLVPGDLNEEPDVFLYDRQAETMTLLSASAFRTGSGNNRSFSPQFSPDGRTLVFQSLAADLVEGDFNQRADLFVLRLAVSNSTPIFQGELVYAPASSPRMTLTWPAAWGRTYRVQFKNSLTDLDWQELSCKVSVVGNAGFATDLAPSPSQRFYRLVSLTADQGSN